MASRNLVFLQTLGTKIALDFSAGDRECMAHFVDMAGPEAAVLALAVVEIFAKMPGDRGRRLAGTFMAKLEELAS